ncbi:MAG: hypothetical protein CMG00_08585 [Candidatus Marinimicrobia bacterium]|nr:hypothetical protein [Candidatus Neomarinimicrobiota bacterium]|tara:strand:+ start:11922 stop:12512 length:591 start_codon:yes stop_codon:yes gene_type:complete
MISLLSISLSSQPNLTLQELIYENYSYVVIPICSNICFDLGLNYYSNRNLSHNKSFIDLHWLASHNLLINWSTSLSDGSFTEDIKSYNSIGFNFTLDKAQKKQYIVVSSYINKLRHTNYGNSTWYQNAITYVIKRKFYDMQFVLDRVYDTDWNHLRVNFIYMPNIFESIFLYFGFSKDVSSYNKYINPFFKISFNI